MYNKISKLFKNNKESQESQNNQESNFLVNKIIFDKELISTEFLKAHTIAKNLYFHLLYKMMRNQGIIYNFLSEDRLISKSNPNHDRSIHNVDAIINHIENQFNFIEDTYFNEDLFLSFTDDPYITSSLKELNSLSKKYNFPLNNIYIKGFFTNYSICDNYLTDIDRINNKTLSINKTIFVDSSKWDYIIFDVFLTRDFKYKQNEELFYNTSHKTQIIPNNVFGHIIGNYSLFSLSAKMNLFFITKKMINSGVCLDDSIYINDMRSNQKISLPIIDYITLTLKDSNDSFNNDLISSLKTEYNNNEFLNKLITDNESYYFNQFLKENKNGESVSFDLNNTENSLFYNLLKSGFIFDKNNINCFNLNNLISKAHKEDYNLLIEYQKHIDVNIFNDMVKLFQSLHFNND